MAANADAPEQGDTPCIDRHSAGESCGHSTTDAGATGRTGRPREHAPESIYLVRIALLEHRVSTLERRLESREADLRHVVDRYERVLQGRDACRDEPLVADEFDIPADRGADREREGADCDRNDASRSTGALARLRGLLR